MPLQNSRQPLKNGNHAVCTHSFAAITKPLALVGAKTKESSVCADASNRLIAVTARSWPCCAFLLLFFISSAWVCFDSSASELWMNCPCSVCDFYPRKCSGCRALSKVTDGNHPGLRSRAGSFASTPNQKNWLQEET